MNNWQHEIDESGIGWLHINQQDSSANILSREMLEELNQVLNTIAEQNPVGLAILSDKDNGFIAGANVKAFAGITDVSEAERYIRQAHEIFQKLEDLPFPTVALIHGFCLGGGLELALACQYRIAADDPDTRIGFPETRLGIFPGFGGSVRSTRIAGHLNALELMLTNRNLRGKQAKKIGLVDDVVAQRQFKSAARQFILNQPNRKKPALLQRLGGSEILRPVVASFFEKQVRKKASRAHYPAPYVLLDHWRKTAGHEQKMALSEQKLVAELITSETAQNLVRVFLLQDKLKSQKGDSDFNPAHVHVVGGGLMGGDIAAWCCLKGMRVTIQDQSAEALTRAVGRAHGLFKKRLRDKRLIRHAMDRFIPDPTGSAVPHADVIIEAIFEDTDAKQALYQTIEPRMKTGAILATNTSSIPLETLGTVLEQPNRLVGLHFFNPVAKMPLLEIVRTGFTQKDVIDKALAFSGKIGKLPLLVQSSPGFLVNRILVPYLMEGVELANEGVPLALIDKAATDFGMPMGPIELADTVGLDICLSVAGKLADTLNFTVPAQLQSMVDDGKLGRKSGEGFYTYPKGKPVKPSTRDSVKEEWTDRLMLRQLNEAIACLRENVVADEESLDAGVIFGTGFAPFRGGPMHYMHKRGKDVILGKLIHLEKQYGERFQPDKGWV